MANSLVSIYVDGIYVRMTASIVFLTIINLRDEFLSYTHAHIYIYSKKF